MCTKQFTFLIQSPPFPCHFGLVSGCSTMFFLKCYKMYTVLYTIRLLLYFHYWVVILLTVLVSILPALILFSRNMWCSYFLPVHTGASFNWGCLVPPASHLWLSSRDLL